MTTTLPQLVSLYVQEMKVTGRSPATITTNLGWLRRFQVFMGNGELAVTPLLAEHARRYIESMYARNSRWPEDRREVEGPLSPVTILQAVKVLRIFGNWCERNGWENIGKELKLPKIPEPEIQVLSESQIQTMLKDPRPKTPFGARLLALLLLCLDSGPRAGEIAGLQLDDLDLVRRLITIRAAASKSKHQRIIPFGVRTAKALLTYRDVFRAEPRNALAEKRLFLSNDGGPLTVGGLYQIMKRLGKRVGIPGLHPHQLRHTFAVRYLLNGGDLATLQDILGHRSLMMTRVYLRFLPEHLQAQHARFSPIDRL